MPSTVDNLTRDSKMAQINAAISDCIAVEIRDGREQDQAVAICHSIARRKTGKRIGG